LRFIYFLRKILNIKMDNKEKIKKYKKEYYENNKYQIIEKQKEYNKNNKEQIIEKSKQNYEKNKDKKKEYYENNKEQILEKNKEYRENNKEKVKEYYENNKERIQDKNKEYRENNKERILENKKCRSCGLFQTNSKPYLCSYCNPDKATRQKTKEIAVKTFLEENNYTFIYNKKCNLDNSCQTYFPDFIIDCNKFFVILECDEDGHKRYDYNCERIRENNICFALGLPCVFIRYNPDKKGVKKNIKDKVLKSYIEYYINKETCDNIVEFLFY
jgi:hypothetical protein